MWSPWFLTRISCFDSSGHNALVYFTSVLLKLGHAKWRQQPLWTWFKKFPFNIVEFQLQRQSLCTDNGFWKCSWALPVQQYCVSALSLMYTIYSDSLNILIIFNETINFWICCIFFCWVTLFIKCSTICPSSLSQRAEWISPLIYFRKTLCDAPFIHNHFTKVQICLEPKNANASLQASTQDPNSGTNKCKICKCKNIQQDWHKRKNLTDTAGKKSHFH